MRDPERIDHYIAQLQRIWKAYPDFRFGQLLMNLLGEVQKEVGIDLFYIEDEEFFTTFQKCYERMMGRNV